MATVKKSAKLSKARAKLENIAHGVSSNKYKIFLTNHGYFLQDEFDSLAEAKKKAQSLGFEVSISRKGDLIAAFSPIMGWKNYEENPRAKKPAAAKRVPQIKNERFMNRLHASIQATALEAKQKNNSIKMQATVSYAQGVIDAGFDMGVLSAEKAGEYLHKVVAAFRAWDKKRGA